jgi:hypothetical protein
MEPEGSLLCSQEPATGSYPEPDECNHSLYSKYIKQKNYTLLLRAVIAQSV